MNQIKQHLPNAVTSMNALCGCIAIVYTFEQNWDMVLLFTILALVADFLDGFIARALKVSSEIGAELDSLADAITFGILPGMVIYQMLINGTSNGQLDGLIPVNIVRTFAFMIPIFSIIRLAKFNVDTEQTYGFKGVPTPANAAFFISIPFFYEYLGYGLNVYLLISVIIIMSLLLVSNVRLIALKFENYRLKENWDKYFLILISIMALVLFQKMAFIIITPVYIMISIVSNYLIRE